MSGLFGTAISRAKRKSVEWYTPRWIFDELGLEFDLDPASPFDFETCVPAKQKLTVFDNGLASEWHGRVFMNPPYGPDTGFWMRRFIDHGNGIALVFSRTDSSWFQQALRSCSAVLFNAGRIEFIPGNENKHKTDRAGAGTAMFACGDDCADALSKLSDRGFYIRSGRV